jgi:hypothetical protein
MKRSHFSLSSIVLSSLIVSGTALLFAGCNPLVELGSDVDGAGSDVDGADVVVEDNGNVKSDSYSSGTSSSSSQVNSPNPNQKNETVSDGKIDCRVRLVDNEAGWSGLQLSNNDLTAATQETMSTARASASHIKGKWYFEISVDAMPDGVWWAQNIGAGVDEVTHDGHEMAHMGASYNKEGEITTNLDDYGLPGGDKYGTGDLIGVATDLDGGRIYFSKNGVWQNGDPAQGTGGAEVLTVPGMGSFYPFISLSTGDKMTANFGETSFAGAPPAGYAAFADGLVAGPSGDCEDPGPQGIPADPAPMTATCGDFTSYDSGDAGAAELHIVSVYEAESGTINIHVDRQSPMVLVLASYDPVKWHVTVAQGAQVQRIIMASYEVSSVSTPGGIPVDSFVYEDGGDYLGGSTTWPNSTGGSDTPELVQNAESKSGLKLTSFGACYSGGSFTITN